MKNALKRIFFIWMLMLGSLVLTSQGGPGGPPPPGLQECEEQCAIEFPDPSPGQPYFDCVDQCMAAAMPIDGGLVLLVAVGILFATSEIYKATKHKKTPM